MSARWRGGRVMVCMPWQCWGGGCRSSSAALPGQEASRGRLKNRSDNQHIVGGRVARRGGGGGHCVHHGERCHAVASRRFWQ